MATDKLSKQTQITIVAAVDGNNVKLFLANSGVSLDASDSVKDKFSNNSDASSVTVTVLSANGQVTVTNTAGSWTWTQSQITAGDSTIYYSSATGAIPAPGEDPATNAFTIEVNGIQADPTVVIKRGGTANNLVVGSGPKQG
jgi:hypothetical protein